MISRRHGVCSLVAAVVLGWALPGEAIVIRVELRPDLDEIDAPVFPEHTIKIATPLGTVMTSIDLGNTEQYTPTVVNARELSIKVLDNPRPTNLHITLRDGRIITIRLYLADRLGKEASRVECFEPGTMPTSLDAVSADLHINRWMSQAIRVDEPVEIGWHRDDLELNVKTGFTVYTEDAVLLPVTLSSDSTRYPIKELQLVDHNHIVVDADLVYAEYDLLAKKAVVHPDHSITAVFRIAQPHQIASGWTLVAVPLPSARISPARFKFAERRKKGALQRQMAIALHAIGGAGNIDDGAGNNESAWTPVQGVGGCVTYGATRHFSMQGCFDVTRLSEIMFRDVAWDEDQGDLAVGETSGRILAGGLVHTAGQHLIPYARIALGARFSKHALTMGSRRESEYRSGALFGFGGGLNIMLGKRAMLGFSASYIGSVSGSDTAEGMEIGLSLAALWSIPRRYIQPGHVFLALDLTLPARCIGQREVIEVETEPVRDVAHGSDVGLDRTLALRRNRLGLGHGRRRRAPAFREETDRLGRAPTRAGEQAWNQPDGEAHTRGLPEP